MHSSIYLVLAALLFFTTLVAIAFRFGKGITDVVVLFCLVFGLFYGLRTALLTLGLDVPYPERYFAQGDATSLAATTILWLTLFLLCFGVGVYVTSEVVPIKTTLYFARKPPPTSRLVTVTIVLTALATVISLILTAKYGGVGGFIRAVKIQKDLTGYYFLKVPAAIGSFCAVAGYLQLRQNSSFLVRRTAMILLGCAILDGFWVFIWGQRSTLVILGVMLALGITATRGKKLTASSVIASVLVATVVVLSVSLFLRIARDQLVSEQGLGSSDVQGSLAHQVSMGTNSIYFDSSMLAFRDWPKAHPYRLGQDFVNGAAGFVPRIVWKGKPRTVKNGAWFRQVYQPKIVNGWPVGAPTLWWINFGPLGIAVGGLLTGFIFGFLRQAQRNSAPSGLNVAMALVTTVYVFQTGLSPEFPVYFTFWLVPLWLVVWWLGRGQKDDPETADSPAPARTAPVSV